ncbi:FadR/GntR family transcriptional regulator [Paenibacillus sabuli]|uniref:FadR/GntR family transcriptional regulator n=1 Tax=Paenibacillus sabuli TaxID=2772509 RepID=UPI001CC2AE19|nr:FCD domain-containing protein [Paenibacillus sabuli]
MKKLAYETVYDEIRRRIAEGEWAAGHQLPPLDDLSRQLGVGISTLREAVRILGKQKVLRVEQGRGTFVASPPPVTEQAAAGRGLSWPAHLEQASLVQLTESRLIFEPELAALAAVRASEVQRLALIDNAKAMLRKQQSGGDFLEEDLDFHRMIADAAHNDVTAQMMGMIRDLLLDSRRRSMKWPGMGEQAASYHILIAHAVAEGAADRARELMRHHVGEMLDRFRKAESGSQ